MKVTIFLLQFLSHHIFRDDHLELFPISIKDDQGRESFVFAVITSKVTGRIDKQKLKKLKLSGRQISYLMKNGELEHEGKLILKSELLQPATAGCAMLIVDVTEKSFIESLRENKVINELFQNPQWTKNGEEYLLRDIVHFGGLEVVSHPGYIQWVSNINYF